MLRRLTEILIGVMCCAAAGHAVMPVPAATGYVTDQTGVIDPVALARTQSRLAQYDAASDNMLRVLLVKNTPDETLEAFADRVLDEWKFRESQQGGALLLWTAEGYVLIRATGQAAGRLDADAQNEVLSRWVIPGFAKGDAGAAISDGVDQMIAVLEGKKAAEDQAGTASDNSASADPSADADANEELVALERILRERSEAEISVQAPIDVPRWFGALPADVERIVGRIVKQPLSGLRAWWREIRMQSGEIGVVALALIHQARGDRVEPAFSPVSIYALYALSVVLAISAVLLFKGAFVWALMMAGLVGAPMLWLATGLSALAAGLLMVGVLAPVAVPVLRAVLRGANDSERDPAPTTPWQPKPHMASVHHPAARVVSRSTNKATAGAATLVKPVHLPASTTHPQPQTRRQESDELIDLMAKTLIAESRKLRAMHAVVAFVLLVISIPLAILAALAFVGFVFYREGVAHRFVEITVTEKTLRERLKHHLPAPKRAASPHD